MKAVVIYSGGMDSFTTLHAALKKHDRNEVMAFSLDYGQRHAKELRCAARVCGELGLHHELLEAPELARLLGKSALTGDVPVPEGHYAEQSMKQTVVPNRNMILLSLAIGVAVNNEAGEVWTGMHEGDHAIYPDCRPEFVSSMNRAAKIANYRPVKIVVPFQYKNKTNILSWGSIHGLDYGQTWTCYKGMEKACGKCGACRERLEAFQNNGLIDPVEYVPSN